MQRQEFGRRVDAFLGLEALDPELAKALGRDERVIGDDAHAEARRAACDLLADAAEAEHTQGLVGELDAPPRLALPAPLLQSRVRLGNVARHRHQQADGVLGGRDDRRLRSVRDDDPAARGGVDVDIVDPDAGAADHLQPLAALDHFRGQLRGRADHDRVVAADRLGEIGVAIDVDVEAPIAQEANPGLGDLFADEDGAQTGVCSAQASSARVTATPRSISAPASASASSTAASAVVMSKTSNQPMWPMRKILPLRSPWPFAIVIPKRSRSAATTSVASTPSGVRIAVTTAERSSSGEKSSSPIALAPSRQARPSRACRSKAASRPSSSRRPSATSRARTMEIAGVNGASSFACALRVRSQSRTYRVAVACEAASRAAGDTDAKATPGGHISAFCEPETTTSIPHASVSRGTAPRLDTPSTTTSAPASFATAVSAWTSHTTPVEVSECVRYTTRTSPASSSAERRSSGSGVSPQSSRPCTRSAPNAWTIPAQ